MGSSSWRVVPQPCDGRCWNTPTESLSPKRRFCSFDSCSAAAYATVTAWAGNASRLATPAIVAATAAWPGSSLNTWPCVFTAQPLPGASNGATRRNATYAPPLSRMMTARTITADRPRLLLVPGTTTERTRCGPAARLARHERRTANARIDAARRDRRTLAAARRADPAGRPRARSGGRGSRLDRRGTRQGGQAGSGDRRDPRRRAGQARDPAGVPAAADGRLAGRRFPLPRQGAAHQSPRRSASRGWVDRPLGRVRGAWCRADAVLRQHRRVRRWRHHGGHLGDRRLVRPDREER